MLIVDGDGLLLARCFQVSCVVGLRVSYVIVFIEELMVFERDSSRLRLLVNNMGWLFVKNVCWLMMNDMWWLIIYWLRLYILMIFRDAIIGLPNGSIKHFLGMLTVIILGLHLKAVDVNVEILILFGGVD